MEEKREELLNLLTSKDGLNKTVRKNTAAAFEMFRTEVRAFNDDFASYKQQIEASTEVRFTDTNSRMFEITFAADALIFTELPNVFEFSRNHDIMKLPYVKEDKDRSYCGVIHIYNFLSDSVKYSRMDDMGYLIGRIFINKEMHYYIEGKQELGLLYNNFGKNVFTPETARNIIESAVRYTVNFDLLTPPYDDMKQLTVAGLVQMQEENKTLATAKRMGFRFQADEQ